MFLVRNFGNPTAQARPGRRATIHSLVGGIPFQLRRIHMTLMNLRAGGIGGCGACLSNARVNRPCGIRRSSIFTMELTSYSSSLPMTNGGTKPT